MITPAYLRISEFRSRSVDSREYSVSDQVSISGGRQAIATAGFLLMAAFSRGRRSGSKSHNIERASAPSSTSSAGKPWGTK
jgi:hypothetical protein